MEEILIKHVKEVGIVKIIMKYKEDIERYEDEERYKDEEILHMLSFRLVDDIIKEVSQYLKINLSTI